MRTKVDDYKGFEIYFDTYEGKFIIEGCDYQQAKPSYASAKKFINDFLKENNFFPEFKLTSNPAKNGWGKKEVIVQGLHSNGNLLAFDVEKQEKFQLSTYNWDDYIFPEDLEKCDYDAEKVAKLEERKRIEEEKSKEEEEKRAQEKTKSELVTLQKLKEKYE